MKLAIGMSTRKTTCTHPPVDCTYVSDVGRYVPERGKVFSVLYYSLSANMVGGGDRLC